MRTQFLALIVITVVLLAFGAVASACDGDGDGGLTLEEYFTKMDPIFSHVDAEANRIGEEAFAALDESPSVDEQIAALRSYLTGFLPVVEQASDDIQDLDPPAEVKDSHGTLLGAIDDFLVAGNDTLDKLDDAKTQAEVDEAAQFLFSPGAGDDITQACNDLQSIAADNNIDVALNCEEDE